MQEAALKGVTLGQTVGGAALQMMEHQVVRVLGVKWGYFAMLPLWSTASALFAMNAKGPIQIVIVNPGRVWTYVERPILTMLGKL